MERTRKYFILPACYIIFNAKVASSSLARAIIRDFYPEIESQIQNAAFPKGKGPDNTQWQGQVPTTDKPELNKSVLLLVRDPIERFRSAVAQFPNLNVKSAIESIENNEVIEYTTINNRTMKMKVPDNIHFSSQISHLPSGIVIKLYKFPDHLEKFVIDAGLSWPLPTINEHKVEKPTLTQEQLEKLLIFYKKDKEVFDSITKAGVIYTPKQEEITESTSESQLTPEQLAQQIANLQTQLDNLKAQANIEIE